MKSLLVSGTAVVPYRPAFNGNDISGTTVVPYSETCIDSYRGPVIQFYLISCRQDGVFILILYGRKAAVSFNIPARFEITAHLRNETFIQTRSLSIHCCSGSETSLFVQYCPSKYSFPSDNPNFQRFMVWA
ncbi:hypothetical protein AVEN_123379-1 [Araneus ventricosus]|uniref:Uncharacterized protein n=1 Tax=Araneus ventricosus TaxID=182803 RepID=A0A4Y2L2J6_ARAVE|nr:hypothetical protein AVEN_100387-1 [Araneus ventricosus]GBN08058.1 hypothetical protein AVEN_123379-1 [Araneus ventricosus]